MRETICCLLSDWPIQTEVNWDTWDPWISLPAFLMLWCFDRGRQGYRGKTQKLSFKNTSYAAYYGKSPPIRTAYCEAFTQSPRHEFKVLLQEHTHQLLVLLHQNKTHLISVPCIINKHDLQQSASLQQCDRLRYPYESPALEPIIKF